MIVFILFLLDKVQKPAAGRLLVSSKLEGLLKNAVVMFQDPGQSGEPRSKQGRKNVDSQAQEEIHYMERHRGHAVEQLEARKKH